MARTRAWRRYKNYTKAKRKREIDIAVSWYPSFWPGYSDGEYVFPNCGMYKNLHQYSKNKIHCSCPWCSPRTRNKGRHRNKKNYAPSINYGMMDKRRQMAMDYDIKNFENENYIKGVKQMYNNYKYIETPNKVIALSTYAGKTVRGVAKCHPNDTFDVEFGRKLAAARCNAKIAAKRHNRASVQYDNAHDELMKATDNFGKSCDYFEDAVEQLKEAIAYLDEVRSSVYDA